MDTLEALRLYVTIAETGSLSAAARQVSVSTSTVTVALQQNASSALLCGQTTVHVAPSDMGVAHFTNLGVQQPTIQPTYYTFMATAVATSGESVAPKESDPFCVGVCTH